jgi:hypothetical protein
VNPQLIFGIGGAVAAIWGAVVAIWTRWAMTLMGRSVTGRQLTPTYVRFIGVFLCVGGILLVTLAVTGVLPDH